jgi:membrane protein implicated in regulation of membrane protease activity
MTWSLATGWWVAAGVLVAAELTTSTFYLLMLALGAAGAALAAHLGVGFNAQLAVAAAVGGGAVALWHWKRGRSPAPVAADADRDVNLDIGQHIQVTDWDANGQGVTHYRGAQWTVRFAGRGLPQPGQYVICRVEGSQFIVDHPPA